MEITPADITEFVQNFSRGIRRDIPITEGHDKGMSGGELPAVGWFTELHDRGDRGLNVSVKWTEEGSTQTRSRASKYGLTLVGGAFTNKLYSKEPVESERCGSGVSTSA